MRMVTTYCKSQFHLNILVHAYFHRMNACSLCQMLDLILARACVLHNALFTQTQCLNGNEICSSSMGVAIPGYGVYTIYDIMDGTYKGRWGRGWVESQRQVILYGAKF